LKYPACSGRKAWEEIALPVNEKLRDPLTDKLFEAILTLETVEECYRFFEDLATISEIKALAQRLEVAKMLNAGLTYEDIVAATGASTATISRVKKCLHYGADGYRVVLERINR
jgi:TrpR-related protein YerC/YecD